MHKHELIYWNGSLKCSCGFSVACTQEVSSIIRKSERHLRSPNSPEGWRPIETLPRTLEGIRAANLAASGDASDRFDLLTASGDLDSAAWVFYAHGGGQEINPEYGECGVTHWRPATKGLHAKYRVPLTVLFSEMVQIADGE